MAPTVRDKKAGAHRCAPLAVKGAIDKRKDFAASS